VNTFFNPPRRISPHPPVPIFGWGLKNDMCINMNSIMPQISVPSDDDDDKEEENNVTTDIMAVCPSECGETRMTCS
jgi:hypothetical protein